ncbi:2614_t:CDS:10 [Acaulospora morrowiae]|uniref:2614_t:CDS:1 n=1 Tax=Acaulospora morrowiae TaxID=94023 RepID=A0A9N9C3Y5_9GLOM|nr:2614_t:CDS:10 [Acaulospora morrowiae]
MTDCKGKNVISNDESLLEKKEREIKHLRKQIFALQNEAIRSFTEAIHYNERILYNVVAYHDRISTREDGGCMTIRNQLIASQAILADARDSMLSYSSISVEDQEHCEEDDQESVKSVATSTAKESRFGGSTSTSVKNTPTTESFRSTIPNQAFVESLKELSAKLAMRHSVSTPQQSPEFLVQNLGQNLQDATTIDSTKHSTPKITIPAVYVGVFKIDIPPAVIKKSLSDMFGEVIAVAKYRHRDHAFAYFAKWDSYNEALSQGAIVISGQMLSIKKSEHAPRPGSFDWYRFRSAYENKELLNSYIEGLFKNEAFFRTQKFSHSTPSEVSGKVLQYYEGIKNRDRSYLAKSITLVESTRKDHKQQAQQLLSMILDAQHNNNECKPTFRIGLSGPPGVGKSTFIESFGLHILSQGHRVSVLTIDPSSTRNGGSILGDKTRMPKLSHQENAYIRPSPSRGTLARNTNEAIILCEAAGYDVCLVETVGVGQSETMVADIVDMFILMVPPAGGDEIQGLKKGIVEISDLVIVNKADGPLAASAREALIEYTSALKYLQPITPYWKPQVTSVSAKTNMGIENAWNITMSYLNAMRESGEFQRKRSEQRKLWMWRQIKTELLDRLKSDESIRKLVNTFEQKVFNGEMTSGTAADYVVDKFTHNLTQNSIS